MKTKHLQILEAEGKSIIKHYIDKSLLSVTFKDDMIIISDEKTYIDIRDFAKKTRIKTKLKRI